MEKQKTDSYVVKIGNAFITSGHHLTENIMSVDVLMEEGEARDIVEKFNGNAYVVELTYKDLEEKEEETDWSFLSKYAKKSD